MFFVDCITCHSKIVGAFCCTVHSGSSHCGNQVKVNIPFCLSRDETIVTKFINSLPNDIFLGCSKLKVFANDKINVYEKFKFVLERVENIVGKGESNGNQLFLLFPQCFQRASFSRSLKYMILW